MDASLDPLFLIDLPGLFTMSNEAVYTSFGWDRDELLHSNIKIIVGGEYAELH